MKRSLFEAGVVAPSMICFGRQYDDPVSDEPSVIDRFNAMVRNNDPYGGGTNVVLDRVAKFANQHNNYTVDDEPELDKYVQTLFLEPFTENDADDYDPYEVIEQLNEQTPTVVAKPPVAPEEHTALNDAFLQAFGNVFK